MVYRPTNLVLIYNSYREGRAESIVIPDITTCNIETLRKTLVALKCVEIRILGAYYAAKNRPPGD